MYLQNWHAYPVKTSSFEQWLHFLGTLKKALLSLKSKKSQSKFSKLIKVISKFKFRLKIIFTYNFISILNLIN